MKQFLILLLLGCALAGCASTNTTSNNTDTDANGQQVSSVPWNRPESWEGGGVLGSTLGH